MNYSRFSNIFWIDASSETNIELELMQIAQANSISQEGKQSESVLQWISQGTNWLMIFDGADGHYHIVEKFLPPGNGGNILITSRNVGLKRISLTSLKVLNMAEGEAALLLLKSASLDSMSGYNITFARRLASELGGIPLALDQAGAYMLTSECDIADYLEFYTKHKHELMSNPDFRGASSYDRTTYGTWDISMQKIEDMATKDDKEAIAAQSAIRILRIFAFLDHANIPEELFKNAAENYMERDIDEETESNFPLSIKLLDCQTMFLSEDGVWEKMKFLAGIQTLISFAFIEANSQLYSMHLLVHDWTRNRIPKAESANLCQKARALLSCSVDYDYSIDNYVFFRLLAPHIRVNALHASALGVERTYYEDEFARFTLVFHCVGSWDEVEKLLLKTCHARTTVLGANHSKTFLSMSNLALTYWQQGRWDEAEKLQVNIMNGTKAKLGSNHPDTLMSMTYLASTYRKQGRWDEAEKLQVYCMNGTKAKLGSNHPDTLMIMTCLAVTYMSQGRWDEAEKLLVDVMNGTKAKLGSNHPDTLSCMGQLAFTYRKQGRLDEAEKLQVDVMKESKAKLGSNHPGTLMSMAKLAATYRKQRRLDEAEKLQVDVMKGRKAILGSNHPDTLMSMAKLAVIYRTQGRWDEAEKLEVDVMNGTKAKLGSNHPDTLLSIANLAATYSKQGRWDEAEKLQVDVIEGSKAKLGSNHPNTLRSMSRLAYTYWNQGRLDAAHSLLSLAVETMQVVMGAQHPTVLQCINKLDDLSEERQHHGGDIGCIEQNIL